MKPEQPYTTKRFKKWNEFKSFADKFPDHWLFRGQGNACWDLKTPFERTEFFNKSENIESLFAMEFQRGAKNFLTEKETPSNLIEWLALMQHHGAPTRLLDFTKSAYVAAYFAFENATKEIKEVAIWAINIQFIEQKVTEYLELSHSDEYEKLRSKFRDEDFEKTRRHLEDKDFADLFFHNNKSCILPVEPFQMNRRYTLQQSIFISTGNSYQPFMQQLEFLEHHVKKTVLKIILPASLKNEALRNLQKMNINRASIFPDLDGYSISLKMKFNSMRSYNERSEHLYELANDKMFKIIYP